MLLLGVCRSTMRRSETTEGVRQPRTQRIRTRSSYAIEGKNVCAVTFRYLHAISRDKLAAVQRSYRENGMTPRRKKAGGRVECERTLTYEDVKRIHSFIENYAEEHALVLPGRVPGFKRGDLRLLPSASTKADIWQNSYKPANETTGHRVAQVTTFRRLWRQLCPHIVCCKPQTDLCWECQKNNGTILRAVNCPDDEKSAVLRHQEAHLECVTAERALYRAQVEQAKVAAAGLRLGENPPCSRLGVTMHYSFDFAQQVHYPCDPLQPGPIYFLTPRKCGIFGVCCEGLPQQVNYLIDEGMATSKGSDAVISYLHHFFSTYGLGEEDLRLHCDNCSGQNKNRWMLFYLIWRTLHGLHRSISLNFMVAGHTKFAPDWCFGLLKQRFRRTPVSCLDDIVRVTNASTTSGVNIGQLVGTEDHTVHVPLYSWQTFLADSFRPLLGMKQFQHFRFSAETPGIVFASVTPLGEEEAFTLLRKDRVPPPRELPPPSAPPGLDLNRQWYLYQHVREFCQPESADVTCPRPAEDKPRPSPAKAKPGPSGHKAPPKKKTKK